MIELGYRGMPEAPFAPDWHSVLCDAWVFRGHNEDAKLFQCSAAGLEHAISNTRLVDPAFPVITAPVTDGGKQK
jgi:hypothetical protein